MNGGCQYLRRFQNHSKFLMLQKLTYFAATFTLSLQPNVGRSAMTQLGINTRNPHILRSEMSSLSKKNGGIEVKNWQ